jgi:hypothetical protein
MELVQILKSLSTKRVWVAIAGVVAIAAATAVYFQVSVNPPGLHSKSTHSGVASTEILIDSPRSAFGDIGRNIDPLTARGGIFSRFLATEDATASIARASGVPEGQLAVSGPKLSIEGVPDQAATSQVNNIGKGRAYSVRGQQGDGVPVLTIFTSAPTAAEAGRLANGTARALESTIKLIQDRTGIPDRRRLTIRQLGPASAATVHKGPNILFAIVALIGVFSLFCLVLLGVPRFRAAWRSADGPAAELVPINGNGHARHPEPARAGDLISQALVVVERAGKGGAEPRDRASSKARGPAS